MPAVAWQLPGGGVTVLAQPPIPAPSPLTTTASMASLPGPSPRACGCLAAPWLSPRRPRAPRRRHAAY
eukprot:365124-Chlamydomonas_euryale.AAC.2